MRSIYSKRRPTHIPHPRGYGVETRAGAGGVADGGLPDVQFLGGLTAAFRGILFIAIYGIIVRRIHIGAGLQREKRAGRRDLFSVRNIKTPRRILTQAMGLRRSPFTQRPRARTPADLPS